MSDKELIEQGRRTASHYRGAFWEGPFSEALDRIEQLSAENERLKSRGIEDMKFEIEQLSAENKRIKSYWM